MTGNSENAERALQERKAANPSWPRFLQATPRGAASSANRGIGGRGIELRKARLEQDAGSEAEEGNTATTLIREWIARSCAVYKPTHAGKQNAREPGDLLHVLVRRSRPVREGHKPKGGHDRSGEVALCRSTRKPAEQRKATFRRGRGGKGTDSGEHRQAARDRKRKQERFTALLHHLSVGLLRDSIYALKRQATRTAR